MEGTRAKREKDKMIHLDPHVAWELDNYKTNLHAKPHHAVIKLIMIARRYKKRHPESYELDDKEIDDLINKRYLQGPDAVKPKKEKWATVNPYDQKTNEFLLGEDEPNNKKREQKPVDDLS